MAKLFATYRVVSVFAESEADLRRQTENSLAPGFRWLSGGKIGLHTPAWAPPGQSEYDTSLMQPFVLPPKAETRAVLEPGAGYNGDGALGPVTEPPVPVRAVLQVAELQGFLDHANHPEISPAMGETLRLLVLSNPVWVDMLIKAGVITATDVPVRPRNTLPKVPK